MPTIQTLTLSCLEHLHQIARIAKRPHYLEHYGTAVSPSTWKHELDGLYKWTMNTGADQAGIISIEHRFKNPNVLLKYKPFGRAIFHELEDLELLLREFFTECVVMRPAREGGRRAEVMVGERCLGAVRQTWNEVVMTMSALRQLEHGVPKLADIGRPRLRDEN
ncbi:MAG: hypothetical protein Q9174_003603 [Haloplaca sp. 1 TL-2023]